MMRERKEVTALAQAIGSLGFDAGQSYRKRRSNQHSIARRFASAAFSLTFAALAVWSGGAQAQHNFAQNLVVNSSTSASFTLNGATATVTSTELNPACTTPSGVGIRGVNTTALNTTWHSPTAPAGTTAFDYAVGRLDNACTPSTPIFRVTITFSSPVRNPRMHFVNMDAGTWNFSETPGLSLTRLSGNPIFQTDATRVNPSPFQAVAAGCHDQAGCGTVQLNGTFTQITATLTDVADVGGDGHAWTMSAAVPTDLAITKTDGSATYAPGFDATYNIVVSNNGPGAVVGARVTDPLPAGISSANWTCGNATGGGVCGVSSGTGAIDTTADLPVGASVTYTLSLGIPVNHTGSLTNIARVAAPTDVADTDLGNNEASDTDTMEPPPTSSACAPIRVVGNTSFSLAPFAITGTVQKSGAPNGWNASSPWTTLGGNYTFTWTFSQPVPANWIRFVVSDVGFTTYQTTPARFAITLGSGSTATPTDFSLVAGWHPTFTDMAYNPSTGVMTYQPSGDIKQAGALQGNSTDTVTSITITATNIGSSDYIVNLLYVRPSCLTVEKVSEGGTGDFTIDLTNVALANGTPVPSTTLTTTAPGTPVATALLYFSPVPGAVMTLGEDAPPGWGLTSAVCTDQNAGVTGNPTVIGTFASPTISIPADNVRPEADIQCRFNNAMLPTLTLTKTTSQMAGGPFGFTLGNTTVVSPATVSTSASGTPVAVDGDAGAGTAFRVSDLGTDVTIEESSLPANWAIDSATCANGDGALVGSLVNGRYTIPAASITMGQTYNCSFVNEPTTNLRINKLVTPTAARTGETVTYTIDVNNDGPGFGDGAVVTDPSVPGLDCTAATLACNASGGAVCPASLDVAALRSTGLIIPTFPAGSALRFSMACTVTATGQ